MADEKKCCAWADSNGIEYGTFEDLCATDAMNKEVLASLVKAGKSGKLGANEILAGILLLPGTGKKDNESPKFEDPWTPENGALTASNKLQRRVIKQAYGEATGKFEGLKAKGIR